jgi:hypothetical protein
MAKDVPAFNKLLAAKGKEPLMMAVGSEAEEAGGADDDDDFAAADADSDAADDPAEG